MTCERCFKTEAAAGQALCVPCQRELLRREWLFDEIIEGDKKARPDSSPPFVLTSPAIRMDGVSTEAPPPLLRVRLRTPVV